MHSHSRVIHKMADAHVVKSAFAGPCVPLQEDSRSFDRCAIVGAIVFCLCSVAICCLAHLTASVAYAVGLGLIVVLCALCIRSPHLGFFIFFGSKYSLDALWNIEPTFAPFRLTELAFAPLACLAIGSVGALRSLRFRILFVATAYTGWCMVVQFRGDLSGVQLPVVVRLSGPMIGLAVGGTYLSSDRRVRLLFKSVIVSTVVPASAFFLQLVAAYFGRDILYYKIDSVRGIRYSGLYYDPATLGMIMVSGIGSSVFYLWRTPANSRWQGLLFAYLGMCYAIIVVGGTRSLLVIATLAISALLIARISLSFKVVAVMLVVLWVTQPYLQSIQRRFSTEAARTGLDISDTTFSEVLSDERYRTIGTGRVALWQDAMHTFLRLSPAEQFLGARIHTNVHNSYIYLLLYGGWLALALYLAFNVSILLELHSLRAHTMLRRVAAMGILGILLLGVATSAVVYTSVQWIVYLIAGAGLRTRHAVT